MHRGVRPKMDDLLWTERSWSGAAAYAESKLCNVLLAFAVARRWKDVKSNALVDIVNRQIEPCGYRLISTRRH